MAASVTLNLPERSNSAARSIRNCRDVLRNRPACGGGKGPAQMKRTAAHGASDLLKARRVRQFFPEQCHHFFYPFSRKPLLPLTKQFLFTRRDKEQFRRQFQRLGLIPNWLRHAPPPALVAGLRPIAVGGSSTAWAARPRTFPTDRRQRRGLSDAAT